MVRKAVQRPAPSVRAARRAPGGTRENAALIGRTASGMAAAMAARSRSEKPSGTGGAPDGVERVRSRRSQVPRAAGGSARGRTRSAKRTGRRTADRAVPSHHANGIASGRRIAVVRAASLRLSEIAGRWVAQSMSERLMSACLAMVERAGMVHGADATGRGRRRQAGFRRWDAEHNGWEPPGTGIRQVGKRVCFPGVARQLDFAVQQVKRRRRAIRRHGMTGLARWAGASKQPGEPGHCRARVRP